MEVSHGAFWKYLCVFSCTALLVFVCFIHTSSQFVFMAEVRDITGNDKALRNSNTKRIIQSQALRSEEEAGDNIRNVFSRTSCEGRRIYMYNLPPRFNSLVLQNCSKKMVPWLDFCAHTENNSFGKAIPDRTGWYATDCYMLELIFHTRMLNYPCLASSPEVADAFYIPYYSGLDALRFLYGQDRGRASEHGLELIAWLNENAGQSWRRKGGRDHFMCLGRTAWDFSRPLANQEGWGTGLLLLPPMENVTALVLEGRSWLPREQAVPYPTSFHPASAANLREWMETVRSARREFLFAFVGATRSGTGIRHASMKECRNSSDTCALLDCSKIKCGHNPVAITDRLLKAEFCLQPPGDSPSRRSTFDGLIAGCIPVFFRRDSAYEQYIWHLPRDPDAYSVFISEENVVQGSLKIEDILRRYSSERIQRMRETIVSIIPRLTYMHFGGGDRGGIKDAFDLSVEGVLRRAMS
eukprot:Gb_17818 [translate_table: standard]